MLEGQFDKAPIVDYLKNKDNIKSLSVLKLKRST